MRGQPTVPIQFPISKEIHNALRSPEFPTPFSTRIRERALALEPPEEGMFLVPVPDPRGNSSRVNMRLTADQARRLDARAAALGVSRQQLFQTIASELVGTKLQWIREPRIPAQQGSLTKDPPSAHESSSLADAQQRAVVALVTDLKLDIGRLVNRIFKYLGKKLEATEEEVERRAYLTLARELGNIDEQLARYLLRPEQFWADISSARGRG